MCCVAVNQTYEWHPMSALTSRSSAVKNLFLHWCCDICQLHPKPKHVLTCIVYIETQACACELLLHHITGAIPPPLCTGLWGVGWVVPVLLSPALLNYSFCRIVSNQPHARAACPSFIYLCKEPLPTIDCWETLRLSWSALEQILRKTWHRWPF